MKYINFKNSLYYWKEKFYLILQLIRKAGYKYFLGILLLRLLNTFADFLSIGFAVNYFFGTKNKFVFSENISFSQAFIFLLILILLKSITKAFADVMREKIRLQFTDQLRIDFLRKILFSSNSSTKDISKNQLIGLMIGNIANSVSTLDQILRFISSTISLLIYIFGLISLDQKILIPILLSILATLMASLIKRSQGWELGNMERKSNNILLSIIGDGLNGLKSIKSAGGQYWLLNKFIYESSSYRNIYKQKTIRKAYFDGFKDLFLVLIVGLWLMKYSDLTNNAIIISTLLFSYKVSQYSGGIVASIRLSIYFLPGYKNLIEISKKLDKDFDLYKLNKKDNYDKEKIDFLKWETTQDLKIKKLYLKKNEIIVIKGKSGIGKTTLLDNFIGLDNPRKSSWEIGNKNFLRKIHGKNMNNQISELVAYCPQENVLFEGTLKENLLFSSEYHDEKKEDLLIRYFLKELDLLPLISRFKNLNKNINFASKPFSGGELQRLCVIRTLLRNRPIEIYDEPTHYLDKKTAKQVIDFLIKRSNNKIIIISTHDEYIMKKADRIIDLNL